MNMNTIKDVVVINDYPILSILDIAPHDIPITMKEYYILPTMFFQYIQLQLRQSSLTTFSNLMYGGFTIHTLQFLLKIFGH